MKPVKLVFIVFFAAIGMCSCHQNVPKDTITEQTSFSYLALGDSYTIGESVGVTETFPAYVASLYEDLKGGQNVMVNIIATTGWTTTDLIGAIEQRSVENKYDLVTLLIGVNNQYQGKPFSLYQSEFVLLLNRAIELAGSDKSKVIVVSIPDYAYTPFGQTKSNPSSISSEIDRYNSFAHEECKRNQIKYVNITDITREGLINPDLVASDDLHPSGIAYRRFAERIVSQIKD